MSSWGCASDSDGPKRKKPAAKKAAAKKVPRKDESQKEAKDDKSTKTTKSKKGTPGVASYAAALDGGDKLISLLEELTCPVLWRSQVRTTEVDRRLGRVTPVMSEMQDAAALTEKDPDAQAKLMKQCQKLDEEHKRVTALKEFCRTIRSASCEEMATEVTNVGSLLHHFDSCWKCLYQSEGSLQEMIVMIGKKLLDVPCLTCFTEGHVAFMAVVCY